MRTALVGARPLAVAALAAVCLSGTVTEMGSGSLNGRDAHRGQSIQYGSTASDGNSMPASWGRNGRTIGANYVSDLDGLQRWSHFPIKIAFVHDSAFTTQRQAAVQTGISQWVEVTNARINYQVVNDPHSADITVRFDPTRDRSETDTSYDLHTHILTRADIRIGLSDPDNPRDAAPLEDVQGLSAHEFGHALGINGHSTNPRDIMYPSLDDSNRTITARDLNTLRAAYLPIVTIAAR